MSSPFYVAPRSSGYASGSRLDENSLNKGREYPGRGEQWLPMWDKPSMFSEVQQMFLQGRAATKAGRATDGWTMARAVAGFGVSRGIPQFCGTDTSNGTTRQLTLLCLWGATTRLWPSWPHRPSHHALTTLTGGSVLCIVKLILLTTRRPREFLTGWWLRMVV